MHCWCFRTVIWNLLWESKKGDLIQRNWVVVSNSSEDFLPPPNLKGASEIHWYKLHHNNSDSQKSESREEECVVVLELVVDSCCYVWSLLPCSSCPQDWCGQAVVLELHMTQDIPHAVQVVIWWWVIPISSFSRLFSSHRGLQNGKGALTNPDFKTL